MIHMKAKDNGLGVTVYGDHWDVGMLVKALKQFAENETQPQYNGTKVRLFCLCYDLCDALMGKRDITFLDFDKGLFTVTYRRYLGERKSLYVGAQILWPELLFITMALNELVNQDKYAEWDESAAYVRVFQSAAITCLKKKLPAETFADVIRIIKNPNFSIRGYTTQYIDVLNAEFLDMEQEKRLSSIQQAARRIARQGDDYQEVQNTVRKIALRQNCRTWDVRLNVRHPEEIMV
ncbi:hypothetical protein P6P90_16415 [Ectobacillus antri]|uniref:Uncharacterized protein n=1 Tax=Ectobacillus antri TaxID=2486280 RepID=A0ABT6HAV3_9BACI|nr:hypothetical protein [Ectobacillus antri]MDG4658493.1 hypothetical protein [Ectobacillus antri]MDG5755481.1 hypothetical protein [Ectobacillus antri]